MSSRRAIGIGAALCLASYVWVYATGLADAVVRSDGFSYYVYLPSWFLHHDSTLSEVARDCCGGHFPEHTGISRWPGTRRWVNVHPIGVAVMQSPVFPLSHALTRWSNLSPDGFSLYYHHGVGLASLAWTVAGLVVLRRLLQRHFDDRAVTATLFTVVLGTNLLHYASFDASYSHVYSFFLFAAFLHLCVRWHERPSVGFAALLGCTAGLIVLTRHTNAVFLIVFPLWGAPSLAAMRQTFDRIRANIGGVVLMAAIAIALLAPQLAIYYQATGRFFVSSYGDLGFNWSSPTIFAVLFGVAKGLFFWSPLLLLSVVGFVRLWRSSNPARALVGPSVVFLALHTYLIASWWDWQLGGSYGSRGFVDALPVFAVGLASFFDRALAGVRWRGMVIATVIAGIALSLFQMLQYWYGIIPFMNMSWERYREVFLRWQ